MNISLTPELDNYIKQKVGDGLYNSASEVVRESLRLLRKQDELQQTKLDNFRAEIDKGIRDIEEGRFTEYDVDNLEPLIDEITAAGRKRLASLSGK